jgi:hypothetical protein
MTEDLRLPVHRQSVRGGIAVSIKCRTMPAAARRVAMHEKMTVSSVASAVIEAPTLSSRDGDRPRRGPKPRFRHRG